MLHFICVVFPPSKRNKAITCVYIVHSISICEGCVPVWSYIIPLHVWSSLYIYKTIKRMYLCQPILWRNMCTMVSRQVNNVSDMIQWRWCLFYLDQHAVHYNLQWNNSSREAGVLGRSTTAYYNCIPCTMQNDIISHTIWNMFYIYRNKKKKASRYQSGKWYRQVNIASVWTLHEYFS